MDADVSRWVLEFLIRQPVSDSLVNAALARLPVSIIDSRLKKTILLRSIQSEVADASVSESVLETLEIIEEMDRNNTVSIMESLKAAYCAVAVECTVKYLEVSAEKYLDAVNRIWRGKVRKMEKSKCLLVSDDLRKWKEDIEAAICDPNVRDNLLKNNTRSEAFRLVRAYLGEAWAIMGPSFLELATSTMNKLELKALEDNRIQENLIRPNNAGEGFTFGDRLNSANETNHLDRLRTVAREVCDNAKGRPTNSAKASLGDIQVQAAGVINETRESGSGDKEVDGRGSNFQNTCLDLVVSVRPIFQDKAPTAGNQLQASGSGSSQAYDVVGERVSGSRANLCNGLVQTAQVHRGEEMRTSADKLVNDEEGERVASLHNAQNLNFGDNQMEKDKEIQKDRKCVKRKHVPGHRRPRGRVKITEKDDLYANTSGSKYDSMHASPVAETAIKDTNHEPSIEKRGSEFADAHKPSMVDNGKSIQENEANLGSLLCSHRNNVHKPSLMERNCTAQTYEWNDSSDSKRPHLPTPKRIIVTPLKKDELKNLVRRRQRKKWSLEEENVLRDGIKEYGMGNWKLILNRYRDVFDERTDVDLKDKWRNLMRYR